MVVILKFTNVFLPQHCLAVPKRMTTQVVMTTDQFTIKFHCHHQVELGWHDNTPCLQHVPIAPIIGSTRLPLQLTNYHSAYQRVGRVASATHCVHSAYHQVEQVAMTTHRVYSAYHQVEQVAMTTHRVYSAYHQVDQVAMATHCVHSAYHQVDQVAMATHRVYSAYHQVDQLPWQLTVSTAPIIRSTRLP